MPVSAVLSSFLLTLEKKEMVFAARISNYKDFETRAFWVRKG